MMCDKQSPTGLHFSVWDDLTARYSSRIFTGDFSFSTCDVGYSNFEAPFEALQRIR
jgi:hypothetical protein